MTKIVTGAAGFIGSSIARRLLEIGEDVIGIDCFIDYYPRAIKESNLAALKDFSNFRFIEANIVDLDLSPFLDAADGIFHQAAQAGVRASWGDDFAIYTRNNILATQKILEAVKGRDIRVVYASSSSVYGETRKLPMSEDDIPRPVSPYGVSKLAAEHLCVLYHTNYDVPAVSLRYFTVYGPRQRPDMAFHRFLKAIITGQEIVLYGDGEQTRDFTFISDAVDANLAAMNKGRPGGVYNIGGGSRVTVNHVISRMEAVLGKKAIVHRMERQKGDVTHTYADTSRAAADLDFHPKANLDDGLAREAAWIQKHIL